MDGFPKQTGRDFKGVYVPKEIWLTPELSAYEKLIFMEIYSLDREFGCVAGNDHFSRWLGIGERAIQKHIKNLKDKELIEVKIDKIKDTRIIHVTGKYARVSEEKLAKLGFLKQNLAKKMKM